jgi:hypothetical protein
MKKLDNENLPAYGDPPASPEVLRSIVYDATSPNAWEGAAVGAVSGAVSGIIAQKKLDELWTPDEPENSPRRDIFNEVFNATRANLRTRGVELIDISIGAWEVDPRIVDQRRELWRSSLEKEARLIETEGEADARFRMEQAKAEAKAEFIRTVAQGLRMIRTSVPEQYANSIVQRVLSHLVNSIILALGEPLTSTYASRRLPRWGEGQLREREIMRAIEHANKTQQWDQLPKLIERLDKP